MANYINLMSEKAQFRAAAKRASVRWALAVAVVAAALAPMGVYAWHERQVAIAEQETLEVQYDPIHQLSLDIRRLRNDADALVRSERTALELARIRPPSTLLGVVGKAAAESDGELYMKRLTLTQTPVRDPQAAEATDQGGRLALEASSSVAYDVQRFVKLLSHQPLAEVKLLSTESATEPSGTRKRYGIECEF